MAPETIIILAAASVGTIAIYTATQIIQHNRRRTSQPKPSTTTTLPNRGPITARTAFDAALNALDNLTRARPHLTLITSGDAINHDGTSLTWDLFFHLEGAPESANRAVVEITPHHDAADPDDAPLNCTIHIQHTTAPPRPLPTPFIDSPDAVRALASRGIDFAAGDSHPTLTAAAREGQHPAWRTTAWDEPHETPFAA